MCTSFAGDEDLSPSGSENSFFPHPVLCICDLPKLLTTSCTEVITSSLRNVSVTRQANFFFLKIEELPSSETSKRHSVAEE